MHVDKQGGFCLKKIMVVGIGNLLMQDEGVGVHAINQLAQMSFPQNVEIIDGGTHSYDLVEFFCQADNLIIIDAMKAGGEPGTIYRAPFDELGLKPDENITSLHEMHFVEAMYLVRLLGYDPEVMVFGVEPQNIGLSLDLTPQVAEKVPRLVELVKEEVERLLQ